MSLSLSRILELGLVLSIGLIALAWRLHELQIEQHSFWEEEALKARTRSRTLSFRRGRILDVRGRAIAVSESSFDLSFRFDEFRKHAWSGRLLLAHYLRTGQRGSLATALREPGRYLDSLATLTVGEVRRMQPRQRRIDLCVYLGWLTGQESSQSLRERVSDGADDDIFEPALTRQRERLLDRLWREEAYLADLEDAADLEIGTLAERIDEEVAWVDTQVVKQLRMRDVKERSFDVERALHREYDARRRTLVEDVPHGPFFHLEVEEKPLPGLSLREVMRRSYPEAHDVCPLLIGSVGHPWPNDLADALARDRRHASLSVPSMSLTRDEVRERGQLRETILRDDYREGEETGRFGLEAAYESVLRGRRGYEKVVADRKGVTQRVLEQVRAVDGEDVCLTLDVEWQKAAVEVLAQQPFLGALVLLDLHGVEVRVLASRPERSRKELGLYGFGTTPDGDPERSVSARAWRPYFPPPPGSVFKPLMAAMALSEGVVTADTTLWCDRDGLVANGRPVRCMGFHTDCRVHKALVRSCNHYFARIAGMVGYDTVFRWSEAFGFGQATGFTTMDGAGPRLNPPEAECPLDTDPRKQTERNLLLFGFGQGAIDDVTPLSVAASMAALARRTSQPPTVLQTVGGRAPTRPSRALPITEKAWWTVVTAMKEVTHAPHGTAQPGTAEGLDLSPYSLATKTGTPQTGAKDHSWFAGFFPVDAPRYAFAVFLEDTDLHGGDVCAPVFQAFLEHPSMGEVASLARRAAD